MDNLKAFRERIRELYSRPLVGRRRHTQKELAHAISLNHTELSNRLHGTKGARLNQRDIHAIVLTLADWGAITTAAEAKELLQMADCADFSRAEWASPRLSKLKPSDAATMPPPRATPPHNLPIPLTSFVGREHELIALTHLIAETRLLTLVGAGGCGKTRLAFALADKLVTKFTDGVWLIELATTTDATRIAAVVAHQLAVDTAATPPLVALSRTLAKKQILLLLDNCEQVAAAVAALAHHLLASCPNLRILVTSRQRLGIGGEVSYRVASLSLPDAQVSSRPRSLAKYEAIKLFIARANAAQPDFRLNAANAAYVRAVCEHLDGLPLAIELAAARLSALSVDEIASRLSKSVNLLTGGDRTAVPRHQTMRACIEWSYGLLSAAEQELLATLAVFVGGFSLAAVEQVCAGGLVEREGLVDLLTQLVNKSLVIYDEQTTPARYRLLSTVKEFAAHQLTARGQGPTIHQRHLEYACRLVAAAEPALQGSQQATYLSQLEQEHDNLRAALSYASSSGANDALLRLAAGLWRFWYIHGHLSEGRGWLMAALACNAAAPELRAKALNGAGNLAWSQGDYPAAVELLGEALDIHRRVDDRRGVALVLGSLGNVAASEGNYAAAHDYYAEALSLKRELGDEQGIAAALNNLGTVAAMRGEPALAASWYSESLTIFRRLDNERGVATLLNNLGDVLAQQGDYQLARWHHRQSLALREQLGDKYGIGAVWHSLGTVSYLEGDYVAAREHYTQSLVLRRELNDRYGITCLLDAFARLAVYAGHGEQAVSLFAAASTLRDSLGATLPPAEQAERECKLSQLRRTLPPTAFALAYCKGQQLDFAAATRYAFGESELPHC